MMNARAMGLLAIAVLAGGLPGCYERVQRATLNPDGSGKVVIETEAAVPTMDEPGKEKPTALTFGRTMAADLINSTRGVEAWGDVKIGEAPGSGGTRARVAITAYFADVRKLRFSLPVVFTWKTEKGLTTLGLERARAESGVPGKMSAAEVKQAVAAAQEQYKDQRPAVQTVLSAFRLRMDFALPGEVTESRVFAKEHGGVTLTFEGKKVAEAIDKFMADDAAMAATIQSGKDLAGNDEFILQSMYGDKGPVAVTFKADGKAVFDYKSEAKAAMTREQKMLEEAGVELVPRVRIRTPATAPGK